MIVRKETVSAKCLSYGTNFPEADLNEATLPRA
jgi:hypothetical protein